MNPTRSLPYPERLDSLVSRAHIAHDIMGYRATFTSRYGRHRAQLLSRRDLLLRRWCKLADAAHESRTLATA